MSSRWLLIETFGGVHSPSVIGLGSTPKRMVPLETVLARGHRLDLVKQLVHQAVRTAEPVLGSTRGRAIAVPLKAFTGNVHGVWVWTGRIDEQPPRRDIAGAWHFNLATDVIGGSDELLDLYGVAPADRHRERYTAEAFGRLTPNFDVTKALALLVRSTPGDEHQAVWTVRRDDGQLRAGHLSTRAVLEVNNGAEEVVLRGITHDIGPADDTPAAPPPVILEQRVLESTAEPGTYRALVNLKSLKIIRWIDEPPYELGWELKVGRTQPWIHPDDEPAARRLSDLMRSGRATGELRLRGAAGQWVDTHIVANIVLLDQHTTAGLFTMRPASP